jgi:Fe-S cluster biogenesis protein NfuA
VTVDRRALDRDLLDAAIEWCNTRMRMHGGGLELVSVDDGGADSDDDDDGAIVHVRFTGMCTGCAWKTLTWFGTVKDAIEAVPGVASVDAPGTRVSPQAEARFRSMTSS